MLSPRGINIASEPAPEPEPVPEPAPEAAPPAPKRKPGRPPGSKNKTTLLKLEPAPQIPVLDIEFEDGPGGTGPPSRPLPAGKGRAKSKAKSKAKSPEPATEPSSPSDSSDEASPPPRRRAKPTPVERQASTVSYIEALTRGIHELQTERAQLRSRRYDGFFARLR